MRNHNPSTGVYHNDSCQMPIVMLPPANKLHWCEQPYVMDQMQMLSYVGIQCASKTTMQMTDRSYVIFQSPSIFPFF